MENNEPTDRLHEMLIARADAAASKRIKDKAKRFGHLHDIDADLRERAIVDEMNRSALVQLMLEHSLTIPAREFRNWRPTLRVRGQISGLYDQVEIIATNGLLGWFLNGETEPICAPIQTIDNDVKPLFSISPKEKIKPIRKKGKSKRQMILDSL